MICAGRDDSGETLSACVLNQHESRGYVQWNPDETSCLISLITPLSVHLADSPNTMTGISVWHIVNRRRQYFLFFMLVGHCSMQPTNTTNQHSYTASNADSSKDKAFIQFVNEQNIPTNRSNESVVPLGKRKDSQNRMQQRVLILHGSNFRIRICFLAACCTADNKSTVGERYPLTCYCAVAV